MLLGWASVVSCCHSFCTTGHHSSTCKGFSPIPLQLHSMLTSRLSARCYPRVLSHRLACPHSRRSQLHALPSASLVESSPAASSATMKTLETLNFDNLVLRELFVDESGDKSTRTVRKANFSLVQPDPVQNPQLVAASEEALALLDIGPDQVARPELVEFFSGNKVLPGAQPAAHCYCGHQFGYFSGQLGDGAAMYLGEVVNEQGERWEVQLKGAGMTPYSRAADGRKVLRSSVREFLCSEAMYNLGIPTTRAATCVTSDSRVIRDPMYDGRSIAERCTIISRVAPTFLRFGSFEIFKPTDSVTGRTGSSAGLEEEMLPRMLHFTIKTYFPQLWAKHQGDQLAQQFTRGDEQGWHDLYGDWMKEVAVRTASTVAGWQAVGWCHGVLNTDNMSIVGLTIDYGPFGFLDAYNPDHVCNGSDDSGRYSYSAQPSICRWNIEKLGEAVRWAVPERITREALAAYDQEYDRAYWTLFRRKLGLLKVKEDGDISLINDLLKVMAEAGADWTNCWRVLSRVPLPSSQDTSSQEAVQQRQQVLTYLLHQGLDPKTLSELRDTSIPASNLAMLVMLASKDPATLHALGATPQQIQQEAAKAKEATRLRKMSRAEKEEADRKAWDTWLARYQARLWAEAQAGLTQEEHVSVMNTTNPRFVLRNWMAHSAIEVAEKGDFTEVRNLLALLRQPFTSEGEDGEFAAALGEGAHPAGGSTGVEPADDYGASVSAAAGGEEGAVCQLVNRYKGKPPAWATKLCVTCSS